ncbi:MAG: serine hydrolase [Bacteroidetes bacterium]|nr:serine hydrolase [Bacteroidota bacterium]
MKRVLRFRIPIYTVLPILVLLMLLVFFLVHRLMGNEHNSIETKAAVQTSKTFCDYDIKRLSGYKYIEPTMFIESECESDDYAVLKTQMVDQIQKFKNEGLLLTASVYFRDLKSTQWFTINENEPYEPASLMKISILITYLRQSETNPSRLNEKLTYNKKLHNSRAVVYTDQTLILGNTYTIRELLEYMIVYSDNEATALLNQQVGVEDYLQTFKDFNLPIPNANDASYPITAKSYSYFLRSIYNAGYINHKNSEFAAELLSKSKFIDGFKKGIPSDVLIIHKFGEFPAQPLSQLHETAIIYCNQHPYLITVMTKGNRIDNLPKVLASMAQISYQFQVSKIQ